MNRVWVLTPEDYSVADVSSLARDLIASNVDGVVLLVRVREALAEASRAAADALAASRVALYVKGDPSLARGAHAAGVHIGSRIKDLASTLATFEGRVSVALHGDAECMQCARDAGVDVARVDALVSPIFETPGKGSPRGVTALRFAHSHLPSVIALGGVDATNASACVESGAQAVAVIRAVTHAVDRVVALRQLAGGLAPS